MSPPSLLRPPGDCRWDGVSFAPASQARIRRLCVIVGMLLLGTSLLVAEDKAAPTQPSRHEVWVPSKDLDAVLKKHPNAVLLDRAQYEALLRDAGRLKPDDDKPPVSSVIENAKLRIEPVSGAQTAAIRAQLTVHGLLEGWSEVKLLDLPPGVVLTHFEGENVTAQADAKSDRMLRLLVRGKGRREIVLQFRSPIRRENGVCQALVPYLARPFAFTVVPSAGVVLPARWPVKEGLATVPLFDDRMTAVGTNLHWLERSAASTVPAALTQRVDSLVHLRANEIETFHRVTVTSSQGPLPPQLRFRLGDAAVQVTRVGWWGRGAAPAPGGKAGVPDLGGGQEVAEWKQDGPVFEITRSDSFATRADFYFVTTKPAPLVTQTTSLPLEVPRLEGASRITLGLGLNFREGLEMVGWQTPGSVPPPEFVGFERIQRDPTHADATHYVTYYESAPERVAVNIRRASDLYSADVDLHGLVTQHDLQLTRTVAFHGEEGGVRRAVFTLPAGEQFLSLAFASGEPIEWKQTEGAQAAQAAIEITWPKTLTKAKTTTLLLSTRKELPAATGANPPTPLILQNLAIPEATRLAGYLALDFDDSWKVATPETTGLELRDARYAPVKGRMAWFHLRDYRLAIELSRHEPVLDAAITAYALPRARTVEIEGQVMVEVTRAPLRTFAVKLPVGVAPLLRWDSPLIGERTLDPATGVWTLTLRRELLGVANLRWHLSLPGEVNAPSGGANAQPEAATPSAPPNSTLAATLPSFASPTARRFSGTWVIEANTDTELSFATKGLQPLDALRAPRVEGYAPRHRVLAAYGYGTAASELRVTATRHESTRLTSAVVETLTLTSVLARDGAARHEAVLRVRHTGDQFFAIRLPEGVVLLSTAVEHRLIKPVTAGPGEVRIPLPRQQGGNNLALVVVFYETKAGAWGGRGRATVPPPTFDPAVPVLTTSWRVFTPEGYSYVEPETTLVDAIGRSQTPTLASVAAGSIERGMDRLSPRVDFLPGAGSGIADYPAAVAAPLPFNAGPPPEPFLVGAYFAEKMNRIILPQVQFRGVSIEEAIEFLRIKSRDYDAAESDTAKRGVKLVIKPGAAPSTAQITLDLKDVPMSEALKYITELGGMKYKIEPDGVVVVPVSDVGTEQYTRTFKVPSNFMELGSFAAAADPFAPAGIVQPHPGPKTAKEVLEAYGIAFPEGSSATFLPGSSQLVVKNTQPNLDQVEALVDMLLPAEEMEPVASTVMPTGVYGGGVNAGAYYTEKMRLIIFPRVQLNNATLEDAIEFVRLKSWDYDTVERDPAKKGVNLILKPGAAPSTARITLDLKDVPMDAALRYITELAGMRYKVEPFAVVVVPLTDVGTDQYTRSFKVPPDFLTAAGGAAPGNTVAPADPFAPAGGAAATGISARPTAKDILMVNGLAFPEGASSSYVAATGQLIVKNSQANLDQVEAFVNELWKLYAESRRAVKPKAKSGVLPVKFELPATGRIFEFRGNQKPETLTWHYQSWERQMARSCFWLLFGLVLFWCWGRRRTWWRTLVMALLLTCVPLALLPSWLTVGNALLAGWLLGLVIWLLRRGARWVERESGTRRAIA